MTEETPIRKKIAIVKNNIVIELMDVEENLAAMFLDNPIFIDATVNESMCKTYKGDTYNPDTGKFDQENKIDYTSPYIEE